MKKLKTKLKNILPIFGLCAAMAQHYSPGCDIVGGRSQYEVRACKVSGEGPLLKLRPGKEGLLRDAAAKDEPLAPPCIAIAFENPTEAIVGFKLFPFMGENGEMSVQLVHADDFLDREIVGHSHPYSLWEENILEQVFSGKIVLQRADPSILYLYVEDLAITVSLNRVDVFNQMMAEPEPLTLRKLCENIEDLGILELSFRSREHNRSVEGLSFAYGKHPHMPRKRYNVATRLLEAYENSKHSNAH